MNMMFIIFEKQSYPSTCSVDISTEWELLFGKISIKHVRVWCFNLNKLQQFGSLTEKCVFISIHTV